MSQTPKHEPERRETRMHQEAAESAAVVAELFSRSGAIIDSLAQALRNSPPPFVVTCARGSSDHAATYARYLVESRLGWPVVSAAPSISSVYQRELRVADALFLAISQSGASPDIVETARLARNSGACVVAMVNTAESPLAELANHVIPLRAGREFSIAATKSYIASLAAIARLTTGVVADKSLAATLDRLPDQLQDAWQLDWTDGVAPLVGARNLFVVARGVGFGIAREAALKLKEVCALHAEAFSAAEVKHGPMAIVDRGFPVLVFGQSDPANASIADVVDNFVRRGATVMCTGPIDGVSGYRSLPGIEAGSPLLQPILQIQTFYAAANRLSLQRGLDPDRPNSLKKVTETL